MKNTSYLKNYDKQKNNNKRYLPHKNGCYIYNSYKSIKHRIRKSIGK